LLDRLDLHVEMPRVTANVLQQGAANESTATVAARVLRARACQVERQGAANSRLNTREIERFCAVTPQARAVLERAMTVLGLSARAYHRVLKVARTLADLAGVEAIATEHVTEGIALRRLDRGRLAAGLGAPLSEPQWQPPS
jgi:magnesium chelatase family protein